MVSEGIILGLLTFIKKEILTKELSGKIILFLKRHWKKLVIAFVIALLVIIFCWYTNRASVSITSLKDGATVSVDELITGTYANIPENYTLLIAIRSGNLYYPQDLPTLYKNGTWTCNVHFGNENDDGKPFEIIVVFANKAAQNDIANNSQFSVFPPEGATEKDKIIVSRGAYPTGLTTSTPTSTPPSSSEPTATTPTSAKTDVTITFPANNAQVSMYEWVRGTSQNIPDGQHMWILVWVDGMYFVHEVETINDSGRWEHYTQIGQTGEEKSFDLISVLADGPAHETLQKNTNNYYTSQNLPKGIDFYDTVTVTRRPPLGIPLL